MGPHNIGRFEMAPVVQAVIAAGGVGSTMLPMTHVLAKEMLPIRDKPVLEHLVCELRDAGIRRVLFVVSSRKTIVMEYFGSGSQWEMEFAYRVQDPGDGPGAPVLLAESWLDGGPFVYAFGDNLIVSRRGVTPPLQRLLRDFGAHPTGWSLLAQILPQVGIPRNETVLGPMPSSLDGENSFDYAGAALGRVSGRLVACGARWVFTPSIFDAQRRCARRATGELYLVDAVQGALRAGQGLRIVPLNKCDRRFNMDTWPTYQQCAAYMARPELDLLAEGRPN